MDICEKLQSYVKACEMTGNGASTHCCDVRDVITEVEQLRADYLRRHNDACNYYEVLASVRDWVSKPLGSYSLIDLDRLFKETRDKIRGAVEGA